MKPGRTHSLTFFCEDCKIRHLVKEGCPKLIPKISDWELESIVKKYRVSGEGVFSPEVFTEQGTLISRLAKDLKFTRDELEVSKEEVFALFLALEDEKEKNATEE
jgi:hypothetical protein